MKSIGHSLEQLNKYFEAKSPVKPKFETSKPGVREKRITNSNGTFKIRRRVRT